VGEANLQGSREGVTSSKVSPLVSVDHPLRAARTCSVDVVGKALSAAGFCSVHACRQPAALLLTTLLAKAPLQPLFHVVVGLRIGFCARFGLETIC
jgi:hypothetical protein